MTEERATCPECGGKLGWQHPDGRSPSIKVSPGIAFDGDFNLQRRPECFSCGLVVDVHRRVETA